MKLKLAVALIVLSTGISQPVLALSADPLSDRNTQKWNLKHDSHLAIEGYDPVSYFPVGGGKPAKGDKDITLEHKGATYRFVSKAHRDLFQTSPSLYEPAYGGWCAWAMKDGEQVDVDPTSFIVKDDRLFLFYNGFIADTRAKWIKQSHEAQAAAADIKWKSVSGEEPRKRSLLKQQLDALSAAMDAQMTPQQREEYEKGIKDIAAMGVVEHALKVGVKAPDFELPDATGHQVSLKSLLAEGPVIVTFYRGGWCPYCNLQLHAFQDSLADITAAGGKLIAISPQTPDNSISTTEKQHLQFTVLSDVGSTTAKAFGVAYTLPKDVVEKLKSFRLDLSKLNGDDSNQLPIAATYVIKADGIIAYAFVDADYRKRAEPSEVIAALKTAK